MARDSGSRIRLRREQKRLMYGRAGRTIFNETRKEDSEDDRGRRDDHWDDRGQRDTGRRRRGRSRTSRRGRGRSRTTRPGKKTARMIEDDEDDSCRRRTETMAHLKSENDASLWVD